MSLYSRGCFGPENKPVLRGQEPYKNEAISNFNLGSLTIFPKVLTTSLPSRCRTSCRGRCWLDLKVSFQFFVGLFLALL